MITVLTDGECRFCEVTMAWVQKKLDVNPIAFQTADLSQYGLTYEHAHKQSTWCTPAKPMSVPMQLHTY